jgi:Tol biopolymer transport system component
MSLAAGDRLGAFEIVALIGVGGMGEVYRARDTRLKREVAIKILPDNVSHDPDRLARFQREAELLATLNHPNIAAVFGLEETAPTGSGQAAYAIVMELIDGDTLAERLHRGPVPVEETLKIVLQIADALEAAHEKGVIHRDLKPANVKITPDDKVKVLDFGLAKLAQASDSGFRTPDLTNSPTLSMMATQAGVILGTAAYMSPEQAKGFPADQRSDIFSFGTVLYEMLTGRQPFQGDTAPDVMASVLVREADLSALPPNLNPRLGELLRRCLEKHPKKRWQAIGDVRAELETIAAAPHRAPALAQVVAPPRPLWKRALPIAITAISVGLLGAFLGWNFKPAAPLRVARFSFVLGEGQQFTSPGRQMVAISPDGARIVYVANNRLYLRPTAELDATVLAGTDLGAAVSQPVFSPDGQSIAFTSAADRTLKKIAIAGGSAVTLCSVDAPSGMSWSGDDILVGQGAKGIFRVSANGGTPQTIVAVKPGEEAHSPQMLPDGDTILFTLAKGTDATRWASAQIVTQSLKSGERKTLISGGSDARYLPTGHLVYVLNGAVLAVPFDAKRQALAGGLVPVIEGVAQATAGTSGSGHFSVSATGALVYVPGRAGGATAQRSLVLIDRSGVIEPLKLPSGLYEAPRLSPDGHQIVVGTDDGKDANVWIADASGTTAMRRLTFGGRNRFPVWSPDGQRIAFQSNREGDLGIFSQRADGTGPAERLTKAEASVEQRPDSWSPDGAHLSFTAAHGDAASVWTVAIKERTPALFAEAATKFVSRSAFSPDGRWMAYSSNETGRFEIFVQPYPPTGSRFQVGSPAAADRWTTWWSANGKELFFNEGPTRWFVVGVSTQPSLTFGSPRELPRPGGILNLGPIGPRAYDMAPDGQRVLAVVAGNVLANQANARPEIRVVLNWFEELKQRVPMK